MSLKEKYDEVCNLYVMEFVKKHDIEMNPLEIEDCWVGGDTGGVADISDCFFNFSDIRYDVDHNIPGDQIFEWYWNSVERYEMGLKYMNYPAFCKGAPDPIPADRLKEIRADYQKLSELQRELFEKVEEYKDSKEPMFNFFD